MALVHRSGPSDLARRRLLRGGVVAVGAVVAGCGPAAPAPASTDTPTAAPATAAFASPAGPPVSPTAPPVSPAAPSPTLAPAPAVSATATAPTAPAATAPASTAPAQPPPPSPTPAAAPLTALTAIAQPASASPAAFMERAVVMRQLAVAAGDQPFGAIVVKENRIVGLGPSQVVVKGDPTAHAEMEAIRDAARRLGTRDLSGCVLYATSRPCRMCEAASVWANIARVYYGDQIADGGPPRLSAC